MAQLSQRQRLGPNLLRTGRVDDLNRNHAVETFIMRPPDGRAPAVPYALNQTIAAVEEVGAVGRSRVGAHEPRIPALTCIIP